MGAGEFYSLACALAWAIAVIMFRRSGETMGPFALNLFKNLVMLALMVPTLAVFGGAALTALPPEIIAICLVSGVLGIAIGDTLFFRALNGLGASRTGVISMLYSPFVIVLSSLFLGEVLNALQWGGFLLVMGGLMIVNWPRKTVAVPVPMSGLAIGALAMVCMAGGIVMVKPALEAHDFLWITMLRLIGGLAGQFGYALVAGRVGPTLQQWRGDHHWPTLIAGSVIGTYMAMMMWLAGYKYAQAAVAAILNESSAAFILLLAWWWLGERLTRLQLFGSMTALAGVCVVALA